MSQIVSTRLLCGQSGSPRLDGVIKILLNEGWTIPKRGGEHHYLAGGKRKQATTTSEIVHDLESSNSASVGLDRNNISVRVEYDPDSEIDQHEPLTSVRLWSWESEFKPPQSGWNGRSRDHATNEYVQAVSTAVMELTPDYGCGTFPDHFSSGHMPTYDDVLDGRVRMVFWLNVFGPKNISLIGRDRIESAPVWLVQNLGSDHILVVTKDNPVRPSDKWADATDALKEHLRIGNNI